MRVMAKLGIQVTSVCLALFMLVVPIAAQTTSVSTDANSAMTDARQDAQIESNDFLWFIAGCLGGPIGLIVSYVVDPNPPAMRLLGKSPEYVAVYSDTYRRAAKDGRTKMAWVGCGALAAIYIIYATILFSALSQSSSSSGGY